MSLKGQYDQADEKSVGTWRNTKCATGVYTFQHAVAQWLFFSKGSDINSTKYPGWDVDGFIINVITEKSKNTTSKHAISLVFDKRNGIDKFWSEFLFINSYCPTEVSFMRSGWEPSIPLFIKTEGAYSVLEVINPLTGEIEYQSKKFYKKNAKKMYEEDPDFHKWFDIAVDYSCRERISKGLLKIGSKKFDEEEIVAVNVMKEGDNIIIENDMDLSTDVEVKSKKRGRKKKEDSTDFAPKVDDDFISESVVIEE